jgi:hypothetical protein
MPDDSSPPTTPGSVDSKQLTNPPRSRVIGRGVTTPAISPFNGLSTLQLINIQSALQARQVQLEANPGTPGNSSHVTAVNSLLSLLGKRLATTQTTPPATQPGQPMLPSIPAKQGVRPSPLYNQPPVQRQS